MTPQPGSAGTVSSVWGLFVGAARAWSDDRAMRLGAGLAYYSLFAMVPVLTLAVSLASLFFDQESVAREVYETIANLVNDDVAGLIVTAMEQLASDRFSAIVPLMSLGVLIFTATLLFVAWREVVDIIWGLPRQRGVRAALRKRGFGFAAVLGAGLVLTLILMAQALVRSVAGLFYIDMAGRVWTAVSSVASIIVGISLLAVLFRYSPGTPVPWRSVWLPATASMVLLTIGAQAYGWYVDTVGLRSAAGVAGTAFLGLVLVYYGAQILLYGIEMLKLSHLESPGKMSAGQV